MGWLFDVEQTSQTSTPRTCSDKDIVRVCRAFPLLVRRLPDLPPLLGGLLSWSWQGAVTAFFWGSLVRVALLHHVTWSINSICHAIGKRPFKRRDRSGNVWWLAVLSMGESWHNLHHADPTCARHGVCADRSTPARASSAGSRRPAGRTTCAGRSTTGWTRGATRTARGAVTHPERRTRPPLGTTRRPATRPARTPPTARQAA